MSSEKRTAAEAELGVIRLGHGDDAGQASFPNVHGVVYDEKTRSKDARWSRRWEAMPSFLRSWWSSEREREAEVYIVQSASERDFGDFRSNMKGEIDSSTVPMAAEDGTHRSRRSEIGISPLLLVLLFFVVSTGTALSALWTLPLRTVVRSGDQEYALPKTLADISSLAWALKEYSGTSPSALPHVLAVLSIMSVWANAWSVPGSVLLNVLTGALLPPFLATLLQTITTTIGSLTATTIAAPLTPLITRFLPSINTLTHIALGPHPSSSLKSSFWGRLAILRLLGIVPWSSINFFSGLARPRISLLQCAVGAFIGVLPWTAVTCQIGDILSSLTISSSTHLDSDDALTSVIAMGTQTISSILTSREAILKLLLLTLLSLSPVLAKEKLQAWLNGNTPAELPTVMRPRSEQKDVVTPAPTEGAQPQQSRLSIEWGRRNVGLGKGHEDMDDDTLVALSMVKERL